jgi:hypothetical protein
MSKRRLEVAQQLSYRHPAARPSCHRLDAMLPCPAAVPRCHCLDATLSTPSRRPYLSPSLSPSSHVCHIVAVSIVIDPSPVNLSTPI